MQPVRWHLLAMTVVLSTLTACGADEPPPTGTDPTASVPASLTLTGGGDTLTAIGAEVTLVARVADQHGATRTGDTIAWRSSDTTVVAISPAGVATAQANGSASIVAALGSLADTAGLVVQQRAASFTVTPLDFRFTAIDETRTFVVDARDAGDTPLQSTGVWQSRDTTVLAVDAPGTLRATGNGTADILILYNPDTLAFTGSVAAPVAFTGATVIPMSQGGTLGDQTVLVEDGVIVALGPTGTVAIPPGTFVIDAGGRFLMPGLADMHIHFSCATGAECANDLFVYLANGVTSARVMWGSTGVLNFRRRVADGVVLGPTLFAASPGMDGPGGAFGAITPLITSEAQARATVQAHASAGYDFIKVYNALSRPVYDAIIDEAGIRNIPVIGHKPGQVPYADMVAAGQRTSEHLLGLELETTSTGSLFSSTPDLDSARSLLALAAAANMALTPTLFINTRIMDDVPAYRASAEARYISQGVIDFSENVLRAWNVTRATAELRLGRLRALLAAARDKEVPILLGTDAGVRWTLPGFSIGGELDQLVQAGLTPFEALAAGTVNAARFVGAEDDFGAVAVGQRADLLLLEGDPLVDVTNVRRRVGVMVNGVWLREDVLQSGLEDIARAYNR